MKRIISLLLLFTFLLTSTELSQFLKLPILFEHFSEHREENKAISFLDFISMHYSGEEHSDHDRDMQLPFKSLSSLIITQSHFVAGFTYQPSFNFTPLVVKTVVVSATLSFTSSYSSSIWQPPKFC